MNRGGKAARNALAGLLAEGLAILCGFLLPRLILRRFGSSCNGLIQSVSQFLSFAVLLRAGVGGAARAALYRTLAGGDIRQVSATVRATEQLMRKAAWIFAGLAAVFACVYPLLVRQDFEWAFSASLVLILSLSTFVQYHEGIAAHILLQADQRQYVTSLLNAGMTLANLALSVLLIHSGCGIHAVKLGTAAVYSAGPAALRLYVKKRYRIQNEAAPDFSSISQRFSALFHQVAGLVYSSTDILLITLFSDLKEVSVYATYCLVGNGLNRIMTAVTSGVEAAFGDMLARKDQEALLENVRLYETLLHSAVCVLFGTALVLIVPFVQAYTAGVGDADYSRPVFGCLLILTEAVHLLRQPYHSLVEAAGHYRQTRHIPLIQALMNLGLSLLWIRPWGLAGVILGTLVSDVYQGIAYRRYVQKHVLPRIRTQDHVKRWAVTALAFGLILFFSRALPDTHPGITLQGALYALLLAVGAAAVTGGLSLCFYRKEMLRLARKLRSVAADAFRRA